MEKTLFTLYKMIFFFCRERCDCVMDLLTHFYYDTKADFMLRQWDVNIFWFSINKTWIQFFSDLVIGEDCSMWPQAQEDVTNKFGNVDIIPSEGLHFFYHAQTLAQCLQISGTVLSHLSSQVCNHHHIKILITKTCMAAAHSGDNQVFSSLSYISCVNFKSSSPTFRAMVGIEDLVRS